MTEQAGALELVLARTENVSLTFDGMHADELKRAARFWYGITASNKMRKAEAASALAKAFQDRERVEAGLEELADKQREILAVVRRYGGAMSGPLLRSELQARGLVKKPKEPDFPYTFHTQRDQDPVRELQAHLLLVPPSGYVSRYDYYSFSRRETYIDLALPPQISERIEPAGPLPWKVPSPPPSPTETYHRSPAEVALDLWSIAQGLHQADGWKTNRGGSLAKSVQNKLRPLVAGNANDPFVPPQPESLYYEILRGLGATALDDAGGRIRRGVVEEHLRGSPAAQAWHRVRAWMHRPLWQDGVGVVPERYSYGEPEGIEPSTLVTARELLVWALCRLAHAADVWLDLETFLVDLWSVSGDETNTFYWSRFAWRPSFFRARNKDRITENQARQRAFWLDSEGAWAANALLGTFVYLALVERGRTVTASGEQPCFRLTSLGRAVFGAPELTVPEPEHPAQFLTVQPNFEVLAHLDVADARAVWPLAQMAHRAAVPGGMVQTFTLTRESVYQGLETGLSVADIQRFLTTHSKTGLPDNVARSLAEWGRKRETLVLRTDVALGVYPPEAGAPFAGPAGARPVGPGFVLLPHRAVRGIRSCPVADPFSLPDMVWQVEEEGRLKAVHEAGAVPLARLGQFADPDGSDWKITAASVRRARERGIPADQVLHWLETHQAGELPAIMETAIRNWSSPAGVFLGDLVMLQVPEPRASAMIRDSRRFRPFLLGHIPPAWFLVRPDRRAELRHLLEELGFVPSDAGPITEPSEPRPRPQRRRARPEE